MALNEITEGIANKAAEKIFGNSDFFDGLKNLNTDVITGKNKEILNLDKQAEQITQKGEDFLNTETAFGKIGELLGINRAYDLVKNIPVIGDMCKKTHINNINEKISGLDKAFTQGAYTKYTQNKQTNIAEADLTRTKVLLNEEFDDPEDAEQIAIKSKIPEDYAAMQKAIIESLTDDNINNIITLIPGFTKAENGIDVVDTKKIVDNKEIFADTYLKIIVPKLAKQDFIKSPNVDKETFALAIFGNLVGEKYFVEGINLGIVNKNDYLDNPTTTPVTPEITENSEQQYIQTIADKFSGDQKETIIKYGPKIFQEARKYDETKGIIPTIFAQIEQESSRDINKTNNDGENSIGLMQINKDAGHEEEAKKLGFDINTPEGNIGYGVYYLAKCIKEKGNLEDGLDMYNGNGNFDKNKADRYSAKIQYNIKKYLIPEINLA